MVQSELVAQRFDVVSLMTEAEARSAVTACNHHMRSARAILLDLYERRGWEALGYTSWRECAVAEFEQTQRTLYKQLEAAEIERRIAPVGQIGAIPERQIRPLAAVPPEQQPAVWQAAHDFAADRGERFGTKHVTEATKAYIEDHEEATIARSPRFNDGMKSSDSVSWYTPEKIYTRVRSVFGGTIDTDPCTSLDAQERIRAQRYYTLADDGLAQPWEGNAFVNPPYGDEIGPWIPRTVEAYESGECRSVIMLVPGRTDTDWFEPLLRYPICIVHGRLTFWNPTKPDKPAPFPSIVVYLGPDYPVFRDWFSDIGYLYKPDLEPIG